jgi:hypothetical protein
LIARFPGRLMKPEFSQFGHLDIFQDEPKSSSERAKAARQ